MYCFGMYMMNVWDTSQKFGIWGFCQNFLQKYCDSLKRDSIFWQGSPTVLGDYCQIQFLWCSSDDPNNQITEFGYSFFQFHSDHLENWRASLKTEFS
jgi:hypothetical protein